MQYALGYDHICIGKRLGTTVDVALQCIAWCDHRGIATARNISMHDILDNMSRELETTAVVAA